MSNVVDMYKWKRARLGRVDRPVMSPRPPRNRLREADGFVRIGTVSLELLERLK